MFYTLSFFFFNDTATTEIYTLSLHDALPISAGSLNIASWTFVLAGANVQHESRSEEHTSELQSLRHLVCRLLLEKKKEQNQNTYIYTHMDALERQAILHWSTITA